jgi:hypothetical protein
MDNDTFDLRGGANEVKYNELTKSITLTLGVTDYDSANPLTTGIITGSVQFQDGTGAGVEGPYIAGSGTHTITSYTANNGIAAGSLKVAASQDAEDTLKLQGLDEKIFILAEQGTTDNQITVKLGSGDAENSVILTGFELINDAASNDIYDFDSLVNAVAGLDFVDNAANDHDTVKVGNDVVTALGTPNGISLADINGLAALAPAGFDFDVLDVTNVTDTNVTTLTGVAAGEGTDEVVMGAFAGVTDVNDFESVVFTQAEVVSNGTTYVLDTTNNKLTAGAKTLTFNQNMNVLSFGGTVLEDTLGDSTALNATTGVSVTTDGNEAVTLVGGDGDDTLTGSGGNDMLVGGAGDDTLDGSRTAAVGEKSVITLGGGAAILNGAASEELTITGNAASLIVGTLGDAGAEITTSGATADADQIGALLRAQTTSFLETQLGYTAGDIASTDYNASTNEFTINFTVGAGDVTDPTTAVTGGSTMTAVVAETAGTAAVESSDTYVFEASATGNGVDTLNNFNVAGVATDDNLDATAFLGAGANTNTTAIDLSAANLDLATFNNTAGVVYNKGTLTASDITTTVGTAGKISIDDNGKAVVLATADQDGVSDAVANAYNMYYIQDTNLATGAGEQTWSVQLVGTVNTVNATGAEVGALNLATDNPFV